MRKLAQYENGTYVVTIYEDGTKVKELKPGETEFISEFPDNIDCKLTNMCNMRCPNCHEQSVPNGKHGRLEQLFLRSLRAGTEIALGGGNILEHPQYLKLLKYFKAKGVFCSVTIHQTHVAQNLNEIRFLIENNLIKGLGISYNGNTTQLEYILKELNYEHIVVHVIAGIITIPDLKSMSRMKIVPKILILGYKQFGRGIAFFNSFGEEIDQNIKDLNVNLKKLVLNFPTVSFDNLALEQLDVSQVLTKEQFDEFYMGDDGQHSMYVDLVEEQFALSSRSPKRFKLLDNIEDMLQVVKKEGK